MLPKKHNIVKKWKKKKHNKNLILFKKLRHYVKFLPTHSNLIAVYIFKKWKAKKQTKKQAKKQAKIKFSLNLSLSTTMKFWSIFWKKLGKIIKISRVLKRVVKAVNKFKKKTLVGKSLQKIKNVQQIKINRLNFLITAKILQSKYTSKTKLKRLITLSNIKEFKPVISCVNSPSTQYLQNTLSLKSRKQLKKALFLQKYMTKKQSLVIKKVKKYALLTKWFKKPKYKLFFKKIITRFKFLLNSKTTQIKSLVLKKNSLTFGVL